MEIKSFIKLVNRGNAWSFILLFIRHPFNLIPTFLATYQCVKISDDLYGKLHHRNNVTNAFRHALWNFLIAYKCSYWRKNKRKALKWTRKITDWHEEFSPNAPLEKEMDLHNNYIGRKLFIENVDESVDGFLEILNDKVQEAQFISTKDEIKKYK